MSGTRTFVVIASMIVVGCSGSDVGAEKRHPTGAVQKGPYNSGSQITVQTLNVDLDPTGDSYVSVTEGDAGAFSISDAVTATRVEVIGDGFYLDEISGESSSAPLSLRAICDLSENEICNVNTLTTLMSARIRFLVAAGSEFSSASDQAMQEALAVFHIDFDVPTGADDLDISASGDGNAVLLAVSSVLLQGAHLNASGPELVVAGLSQLMADIGSDLETDGDLDDDGIELTLGNASLTVPAEDIRATLESHYGLGVTLPVFEDYLDTDWDGVVNGIDPEGAYPAVQGFVAELRWTPPNQDGVVSSDFDLSLSRDTGTDVSQHCRAGYADLCLLDWSENASYGDPGDPVATRGVEEAGNDLAEDWERIVLVAPEAGRDYYVKMDCYGLNGQPAHPGLVLVWASGGNGVGVAHLCSASSEGMVPPIDIAVISWPDATVSRVE